MTEPMDLKPEGAVAESPQLFAALLMTATTR
jgi:hypothetical protein